MENDLSWDISSVGQTVRQFFMINMRLESQNKHHPHTGSNPIRTPLEGWIHHGHHTQIATRESYPGRTLAELKLAFQTGIQILGSAPALSLVHPFISGVGVGHTNGTKLKQNVLHSDNKACVNCFLQHPSYTPWVPIERTVSRQQLQGWSHTLSSESHPAQRPLVLNTA